MVVFFSVTQEFLGNRVRIVGQVIKLASIHQGLLDGGDFLGLEMPVGRKHRHLGVVGLAGDIERQLRCFHQIAQRVVLMRLGPGDGVEPAGEETAQLVGMLRDQRVRGVSNVGQERMNKAPEFQQQFAAAGFFEQQRAFEHHRRDRVDIADRRARRASRRNRRAARWS